MMRKIYPIQRGFTLVELLMSIALIAVLSSFVLYNLDVSRTKSRDSSRSTYVKSLKTALELYYNDNGGYPQVPDVVGPIAVLESFLVPQYINEIVDDPINPGSTLYGSTGARSYAISVYYEVIPRCKTGIAPSLTTLFTSDPVCSN